MYADRNVRAKPNALSLTAAIGINAALVAALLLSVPEFRKVIDTPIEAYAVPEDRTPPPKPQPQPERDTKALTQPKIVTPKPDILPPLPSDNIVQGTTDPLPPIPFDPGPLSTGVTVDPPKPAPVLTEAAPDPRAAFQPEYPPSARREGVEGAVTVRVLVGADGRVKAVEQVRGLGEAFFAATRRQALSRWRFKPATRDGIPYESWRTMTVRFVLEG